MGAGMSQAGSSMRAAGLASKAWPFEEARRVLARFKAGPPEKGYVLFETGYGPSGLPHIGTFGEVARTAMIRHAFEVISDIPTRLIAFSDDLDGMRKIPDNVPKPDMLRDYLQKPLSAVPDPFGEYESFAAHNNAMMCRFLDRFGFDYEFISATEFYQSGRFDEVLLRAAERYDDLMAIMLPSLREERQKSYSIFLPISPKTGRVLYVPIKSVDARLGQISFDDEDGEEVTLPVTGGHVKLQWKPDFGARWAALGVDFEMYGKDHSTNTPLYDGICRALGARPPEHFTYELFLDEAGEKISKSKGNGITIDDWLRYGPSESLSWFMYQKPKTAKRLYLDAIPKAFDEYHQGLRGYADQDEKARAANPVYHIHAGEVPSSGMEVSFSMLLNLASAAGAKDAELLWGMLRKDAPHLSSDTHPQLDAAIGAALRYVEDFIEPNKVYRAPDAKERAALADLAQRLSGWQGAPVGDAADGENQSEAEALQSLVYAVGKAHEFEPLRAWFSAIYEVLLGASQGPRFGSFIAIFGVEATIKLIKDALERG